MSGLTHLLTNPFTAALKGSAIRAATVGARTDAALGRPGQPAEIVALYDYYHPIYAAFFAAFSAKDATRGTQIGTVYGLQLSLKTLSDNIKKWAYTIEGVHGRGEAGYITLLPRGRKPFRNGQIGERITATRVLANQLLNEPALPDLQAEVAAFATLLEEQLMGAQGKKGVNRIQGTELKYAHAALCNALYAVAGGLIRLYPDSPRTVKAYFDVGTMRRHRHRKGEDVVEEVAGTEG